MYFKNTPSPTRPRFFIPARIALVTLALGASVTFYNPVLRAADEVALSAPAGTDNNSFRLFYDKLANDGDWLQTDQYGYVFQPRVATESQGLRPYTDGYWARTDSGWTWVSNEDFGWATYHYGRWANLVDTGWVWVPGNDWSPAYVSWRISKDHKHVGWAPLPPEARFNKGQNVEGWVDSAYDIGPSAYTFIDTDHFGETSYRSHLLPVEQNTTFITETDNVTRLDYRTVDNRSIIYDGGPDVTVIREVTGRPVRELHLETRAEGVEFFERGDRNSITAVNGDRLVVATAAPDVITSTSIRVSEPAHIGRRLTNVTVDRGYRGIGDAQAVERVRASLHSQNVPPPQVEREASAAIHRDGAAMPGDHNVGGRNEAAPAPSHDGQPSNAASSNAAASPAPANGRNERSARAEPEASPTEAGHNSAQTRPEASPEEGRAKRQHSAATPAASPEATPVERENGREASPTPRRGTQKEDHPDEHANKPEASPTPTRGEAANASEEHPTPTHSRQPANQSREEQSPTPTSKSRETPAPERESTPAATPRHSTEPAEDKHPKSEVTPHASAEQPARREEKPGAGEGEEKKPMPANAEAGAARRTPGEGRDEEKGVGTGGKERTEKKENPESSSAEKAKPKPTP